MPSRINDQVGINILDMQFDNSNSIKDNQIEENITHTNSFTKQVSLENQRAGK